MKNTLKFLTMSMFAALATGCVVAPSDYDDRYSNGVYSSSNGRYYANDDWRTAQAKREYERKLTLARNQRELAERRRLAQVDAEKKRIRELRARREQAQNRYDRERELAKNKYEADKKRSAERRKKEQAAIARKKREQDVRNRQRHEKKRHSKNDSYKSRDDMIREAREKMLRMH